MYNNDGDCTYTYYLRNTESTSSRQPTVPATTANSAGDPPRSPAPVSTEGRSGAGGSSDHQDEQSRIVLPSDTGEQPSLSSGLSDASWLNRRHPGSLYSIIEYDKSSSSSSSWSGYSIDMVVHDSGRRMGSERNSSSTGSGQWSLVVLRTSSQAGRQRVPSC